MVALEALIALALAFAVVFTVHTIARAQSRETPVYDANGRYQGSVYDYGRTQTYTDRNGQFNWSAVNNGNGTTSFFNRNGQFNGSAGSSIEPSLQLQTIGVEMGSHVDAWKKLRYLLEEEDRIEYINIDHNRWESSPWSDSGRKKEPDPNKADTGKRCHWRAIKSVVRFAAV